MRPYGVSTRAVSPAGRAAFRRGPCPPPRPLDDKKAAARILTDPGAAADSRFSRRATPDEAYCGAGP
ncbi:hypothetical protein GD604_05065 [Desulfolutivibrio sulfoxidireducens]|nr:hypothetical protein GD604_05065 [Desulfolutivibrio sulfoxidireducens]